MIFPVVGLSIPAIRRKAVDLPQPEGPSSVRKSPARTVRLEIRQRLDAIAKALADIFKRDERFVHHRLVRAALISWVSDRARRRDR